MGRGVHQGGQFLRLHVPQGTCMLPHERSKQRCVEQHLPLAGSCPWQRKSLFLMPEASTKDTWDLGATYPGCRKVCHGGYLFHGCVGIHGNGGRVQVESVGGGARRCCDDLPALPHGMMRGVGAGASRTCDCLMKQQEPHGNLQQLSLGRRDP